MCCFMIKAVRWILQALRYCFSHKTQYPPLLNKASFVGFIFFPSPSPPPSAYTLGVWVLICGVFFPSFYQLFPALKHLE